MPLSDCHIRRASARFQGALGAEKLEALAREARFVQRRRVVTATSVFWALMLTLGTRSAEYICRVAPGDCAPGALAGTGQGDFHHPALPLSWLVATAPRFGLRCGAAGGESASTARQTLPR